MIRYNVICLRFGVKFYEKSKVITNDELIQQFTHWNVQTVTGLFMRWNQQPESNVTGLKWIYFQ